MGRKIVFLLSKVKPHQRTLSFLSARGHSVYASTNIQKVMDKIQRRKPDLFVISLDHPNPMVHKLFDLAASFGVKAVPAGEKAAPVILAKLDSYKVKYKLVPSLTGAKITRLLDVMEADGAFHVDEPASHSKPMGRREEILSRRKSYDGSAASKPQVPSAANPSSHQAVPPALKTIQELKKDLNGYIDDTLEETFEQGDDEWLRNSPGELIKQALGFQVQVGERRETVVAVAKEDDSLKLIESKILEALKTSLKPSDQAAQEQLKVIARNVIVPGLRREDLVGRSDNKKLQIQAGQDFICRQLGDCSEVRRFKKSKDGQMLGLKAQHLHTQLPLPSDVFLYFPGSDKYLCMARGGRHLDDHLLDRWRTKGMVFYFDRQYAETFSNYRLSEEIRRRLVGAGSPVVQSQEKAESEGPSHIIFPVSAA